MLIAHLLQIFRNLQLHIVGYRLVALDARILALALLLVPLVDKHAGHPEHTVHALCKMHNLLLSLKHRYLRRLHHTTVDEVQRDGLFGLSLALRQKSADDLLHLGNQPDEQRRIEHIEASVEHSQHDRYPLRLTSHRGIVAHETAHHIDKGIEHHEHPDDAKHIEHQMSQCQSYGLIRVLNLVLPSSAGRRSSSSYRK